MDIDLFLILGWIPHLSRDELRDHAFGDCEVLVYDLNGEDIGFGYFSGRSSAIRIFNYEFAGEDARMIRDAIPLRSTERNDETGPDEFVVGSIMPGLTLEAVLDEITGRSESNGL